MTYALAIDIGASGGRHILGSVQNGRITLEEVYRFDNGIIEQNGRMCWDIDALYAQVLHGMRVCKALGKAPSTVGIDTWGVDYVLIDDGGRRIGEAVAYRDSRTKGADARLEQTLPFEALYERTGIAKQPFNTLYQLMTEPAQTLESAARCLLMPDYLHFLLCGRAVNEYTNASTGALLNARTRRMDQTVLDSAGIPPRLFDESPIMPGTKLGGLKKDIAQDVGYDCAVVLPATHDTGSAFLAVPAQDENAVFLSSGTWSLLGVELPAPVTTQQAREAGFTNEGGYGSTIRFLKNIMGMWIIQSLRKEWRGRYTYAQMAEMAQRGSAYAATVDVTNARFLAPESMQKELLAALREQGAAMPNNESELLACVTRSLARCYAQAIAQLSVITGKTYTALHIVGGGSHNAVLNQWTANETGLPVYAGPGECTALGNVCAQLMSAGLIDNVPQARRMIRDSFDIQVFTPKEKA